MATLTVPTHPRSAFTWSPASGMLTTEASTLGPRFASRLFDDACDIGFAIPDNGGSPVVFSLSHEQRDAEGDLLYEDYTATDPDRGGLVVRVFND